MTAIEIIEKSKQTHEDWLAYFKKNPNSLLLEEYKNIGDIDHHKKCIKQYKQAIAEIEQLQAELADSKIAVAGLELVLSDFQIEKKRTKTKITRLESFVQFVLSSMVETHNAGYVFTNSPENFKKAAEKALQKGGD